MQRNKIILEQDRDLASEMKIQQGLNTRDPYSLAVKTVLILFSTASRYSLVVT